MDYIEQIVTVASTLAAVWVGHYLATRQKNKDKEQILNRYYEELEVLREKLSWSFSKLYKESQPVRVQSYTGKISVNTDFIEVIMFESMKLGNLLSAEHTSFVSGVKNNIDLLNEKLSRRAAYVSPVVLDEDKFPEMFGDIELRTKILLVTMIEIVYTSFLVVKDKENFKIVSKFNGKEVIQNLCVWCKIEYDEKYWESAFNAVPNIYR